MKSWVLIIKIKQLFCKQICSWQRIIMSKFLALSLNHLFCNPSQNTSFPWFIAHPMKSEKDIRNERSSLLTRTFYKNLWQCDSSLTRAKHFMQTHTSLFIQRKIWSQLKEDINISIIKQNNLGLQKRKTLSELNAVRGR